MTSLEKAAYIKGLAEGLELDKKDTAEAKVIKALIELCSEMAEELSSLDEYVTQLDEDVNDDLDYLYEYVDELDDDLYEVEDFVYNGDELCDDDCFGEEDCDGDCENCGFDCDMWDDEDDEDDGEFGDEDYYEIICPSCGETICFDTETNIENVVCPACGEELGCIVDEDDVETMDEE